MRSSPSASRSADPADAAAPDAERGARGVALLVVIWIMALVVALVGAFSTESGLTARLTRNLAEQAKARSIADAGLNIGVAALLRVQQGQTWPFDGTPTMIPFAGAEVAFRVWDESGKIDINVAPDPLLSSLFAEFGVMGNANASLVDAVVDWRSPGAMHRVRAPGAVEYRAQGLPPPRHAPFAAIEDLRLVLGVTPELYRRIAPLITVYSHNARINPTSARLEVLRAVPGLTRNEIAAFLTARAEGPTQAATAAALLRGGQSYLTFTQPMTVRVRAAARLPSGAIFAREAVVDFARAGDQPFRVLTWRQPVIEDEEGLEADAANAAAPQRR
jgi:general secretion pathway protein K